MLDADVRRELDGTPIAHLASRLPDGAPHTVPVWIGTHGELLVFLTSPHSQKARNLRLDPRVALSVDPAENPFEPVIVRGRVVGWLNVDDAWPVIDQLSMKYIQQPYERGLERVVGLIEPRRHTVGRPEL